MIETQLPGFENDTFVECYQTNDISTAAMLLESCEAVGNDLVNLSERSLSCRDLHDGQYNIGKCRAAKLEAYYHFEGGSNEEVQAKQFEMKNLCEKEDGVWSEL